MSRDIWNPQTRFYDPGVTPMPPRPATRLRRKRAPRSRADDAAAQARILAANAKRDRKAAKRVAP